MKALTDFAHRVAALDPTTIAGTIRSVRSDGFELDGLAGIARIGDLVEAAGASPGNYLGEVVALGEGKAVVMAYRSLEGFREGAPVQLRAVPPCSPSNAWLGEVIDAFGNNLDGRALGQGDPRPLQSQPPPATLRRRTGARLETGMAALDTMLPLVAGQRVGLFAGSGVGKSRLLARLARKMEADVVVVGLIGERGREVREFVEETLGEEARERCCVVVATSDQPAPVKRRAAWTTLATAEYFRDQGKNVLLLFDSVTRFAEAHREIALTAGEAASLRGYPPSTSPMIASLAERAGPGPISGAADITAVFTVLVAGSDMDEPVADMLRGVLDGHIVLERAIAERGRFPAIDVRRSVSRSLPDAASGAENALIAKARGILGAYEKVLPMLQVGLYREGGDPATDEAVKLWPALDAFIAEDADNPEAAFERLAEVLGVR